MLSLMRQGRWDNPFPRTGYSLRLRSKANTDPTSFLPIRLNACCGVGGVCHEQSVTGSPVRAAVVRAGAAILVPGDSGARPRHRRHVGDLSVVRGVMLEPLPYRDPDRVVTIWETNPSRNIRRNVIAQANFVAWRERTRSFENLGMVGPARLSLMIGNTPQEVEGLFASSDVFAVLGVQPAIGRAYTSNEDVAGQRPGDGRQPRLLADAARRTSRRRRHHDQEPMACRAPWSASCRRALPSSARRCRF